MALSQAEKDARKRDRLIEKAREFTTGTYIRRFVAPKFQKMVRAEWGAQPAGYATAVVDGEVKYIPRQVGQCVCVTCGKVQAWDSGIKGMHTGHFLASRRNSILFEETNVAPQCSHCNFYLSGAPQAFRRWMLAVHGEEVVERLQHLKTTIRSFERDELVDMRLEFQSRLKAAEERMTDSH